MRTNVGNVSLLGYPLDGSDVSSAPDNMIPSTALQHAYLKENDFGFKSGDSVTTRTVFVHMANGAEQIKQFYCGAIDTGSSSSVTFDLLKNGSSILSAPVTLTNSDADRTKKSGTVASPTLADNDILTATITVSSSTGMNMPFIQVPIIGAQSPN